MTRSIPTPGTPLDTLKKLYGTIAIVDETLFHKIHALSKTTMDNVETILSVMIREGVRDANGYNVTGALEDLKTQIQSLHTSGVSVHEKILAILDR